MEVKIEDGKIYVASDYNEDFIKGAKRINGKWDKPYWVFPEKNKDLLDKLLIQIYGECSDGETVTLIVDLPKCKAARTSDRNLYLDVKNIATRFGRDKDVYFDSNVTILEGKFSDRGGSVNHPEVTWDDDKPLVLRIEDFPKVIYDRIEDKTGITLLDTKIDFEKLKRERKELLKRIAEIDEILKKERLN